jgi:excisionase family DNA binding protein
MKSYPKLPRLLSVDESAGVAHVSPKTIRRRMASGQLRYYRIGSRTLVGEEDLLAMLNACRQ